MNILVTGAAGFVERNLVENLKNIRDGKNRTRPDIVYGLESVEGLGVFRHPKNGKPFNNKPPAMRVESICYAKVTFPITIKLFRLYCRKER